MKIVINNTIYFEKAEREIKDNESVLEVLAEMLDMAWGYEIITLDWMREMYAEGKVRATNWTGADDVQVLHISTPAEGGIYFEVKG